MKAKTRNIACKACGREYDRATFRICPKCEDRRIRWRATERAKELSRMKQADRLRDLARAAAVGLPPALPIAY